MAFFLVALTLAASGSAFGAPATFNFDASKPSYEVDKTYVCFNIDTGSLFNGMNFSDTVFRTLVTNLGPSIIRIGGTAVDFSYYFPSAPYLIGQINDCPACGNGASAIGNDMIDAIWSFMAATNMSVLWDVNGEMERKGTGPWDPSMNFTAMAAYLQSTYGGTTPTFAYSVGNEPDLWRVNHVSAPQLARDAVTLVKTLKSYNIGKDVYGPSWAGVSESDATQFLPIAAAGGVTGYTVHNYPYGGKDCNVSAYLQKGPVTEHLASNLAKVRAVADASAPNMLLVLEEVAGSSGGGCDNVTDRFVAGFAWLNTLATVGASGFHRVHRQDIAGWSFAFGKSNYMLVGPPGWVNGSHDLLTPHPDYYTTLLWKQLVGQRVLNTTLGEGTDYLSASVWCAAPGAPYGSGAGSTVLAWTNSAPTPATVALPPQLAAASSTSFLLTGAPTPQGAFAELQSDDMYLNGALLSVAGDGSLLNYPYVGLQAQPAAQVEAPPYSYGFLVFDSTDVPACIF